MAPELKGSQHLAYDEKVHVGVYVFLCTFLSGPIYMYIHVHMWLLSSKFTEFRTVP